MKTEAAKTSKAGRGTWIALALVLAVGGCDSLLEVELPAQLTDDALETPAAAGTILSTFITHYENAFNDIVWETFGREDGGEVPTTRDAGYFQYLPVSGQFGNMSRSLRFSMMLHEKLDKEWTVAQVPQRAQYLAISSIYAGATLGWMGSALCESSVATGPLLSSDQTLTLADEWLTKALAEIQATGGDFAMPYGIATSARHMTLGLRAQVRWMKGDMAGATADAALVPNGFRAFVTREPTPARLNKPFNSGTENRYQELYDVIDFWKGLPNPVTGQSWPAQIPFTGYRSLGILPDGRAVRDDGYPIRTAGPYRTPVESTAVPDTRVKTVVQQLNGASYATQMNAKYSSQGDDIPMVNWKEMILIRAEAVGGQGAIDLVNVLRAADNLPLVAYITGATATPSQIRYMIIEERRRALFLEARYFYTKVKNLDVLWFPRSSGQSPAKGNQFRGGIRYIMPNEEFQFNQNLSLEDRATGCPAAQRPINIDVGTG